MFIYFPALFVIFYMLVGVIRRKENSLFFIFSAWIIGILCLAYYFFGDYYNGNFDIKSGISECCQDKIAIEYGSLDSYEKEIKSFFSDKKRVDGKLFLSEDKKNATYFTVGSRNCKTLSARIISGKKDLVLSNLKKSNNDVFLWNSKTAFVSDLGFLRDKYFDFWYIFFNVLFCITIIFFLVLVFYRLDMSLKLSKSFEHIFLLFSCIFLFVLFFYIITGDFMRFETLFSKYPNLKNYDTLIDSFDKIIEKSPTSSLQSSPEELKTAGINRIFVGKKNYLKNDFIRFNLGPIDYIYYAPKVSDIKELNPLLTYYRIKGKLWHGRYNSLYFSLILSFCISLICCVTSILAGIIFIIKLRIRFSKK